MSSPRGERKSDFTRLRAICDDGVHVTDQVLLSAQVRLIGFLILGGLGLQDPLGRSSRKNHAEGFNDPRWLTYRQAQRLGGQIRRGQQGTLVVFWKSLNVEEQDGDIPAARQRTIPLLRHYIVFNVDQCNSLSLPAVTNRPFNSTLTP